MMAIEGPSGIGKSSLPNPMGCLDRPFEVPAAWTSPDSFGIAALPQPGR